MEEVVSDLETAFGEALATRDERMAQLSLASALVLIASGVWYIWPAIQGDALILDMIGPTLVMMVCALAVQDLVDFGPRQRARIGAAASVAWLPLFVLGVSALVSSGWEQLGAAGLLCAGLISFEVSRNLLTGSLQALRYRGLTALGGAATAAALLIAADPSGFILISGILLLLAGLSRSGWDLFANDPDRGARRAFQSRLDGLELRVLELRAQGAAMDQASSLVQTAGEVGYTEPKQGMQLLDRAADDIQRTLALASDIGDIRADAVQVVEDSEAVTPLAKRPQRCIEQGDREAELGSLREAELLFRRAKSMARDIIDHWARAEDAISDAKRQLGSTQSDTSHLTTILDQAESALEAENPKQAAEFAETIPVQLESLEEVGLAATESIVEAQKVVGQSEGLELDIFEERMQRAGEAHERGDWALAKGLADSVSREVISEREAMLEVQKALRQRKKLVARWKGNSDSAGLQSQLDTVRAAADEKQWTHAATLLERLTMELDDIEEQSDEARELLDFVNSEWNLLRDKCESADIKVDDAERHACEKAVGLAGEAHASGVIEECLSQLGTADGLMEKLRRRI